MAARVADAATEAAFSLGWRAVRRLPERSASALFTRVADRTWSRQGPGVVQYERNQSRVHPEASTADLRELSRLGMRSYMRYWCEAFRLPAWSQQRVREGFVLRGGEILDAAMASGTGAIMVVNHGGNWDLAGAWAALRYGGLTTVAERLRPEGLFQQFLEYRSTLGMEILPLGEAQTFRTLATRLREGRLVPLVGDRDISRRGIPVDFFGEPASFPAGPALLAVLTNAPLHPVVLTYDGELAVGTVLPRIAVPDKGSRDDKVQAITQGIAHAFAGAIAERSWDWHVMQPLWHADLDERRRSA